MSDAALRIAAARNRWPEIYTVWRHGLEAAGLDPDNPVTRVEVFDAQAVMSEKKRSYGAWWGREQIAANIAKAEIYHANTFIMRHGETAQFYNCDLHEAATIPSYDGPRTYFADNLRRAANAPELFAAIFVVAALFDLERRCSAGGYGLHGLDFNQIEAITNASYGRITSLASRDELYLPDGRVSSILPTDAIKPSGHRRVSFQDHVGEVVDLCVNVLKELQPTLIDLVATPRPDSRVDSTALLARAQAIAAEGRNLAARRQAMQERDEAAWRESIQDRSEARAKRFAALSPRPEDWFRISQQELSRMVWSMPATDAAKLFNISSVAVHKKCVKLEVGVPGRGFWAKVRAGHLPHPGGRAPGKTALSRGDDDAR